MWEHEVGTQKRKLKAGDLVMLHDDLGRKKRQSKWRGPFLIIGQGGEHEKSFTLGFAHLGLNQNPRRKDMRVPDDRLRRFVPREGYLIPSSEAKLPAYRKMRFGRTNLSPEQFQKELETMEDKLKERLANESDGHRQRRLDKTTSGKEQDSEDWEDLEEDDAHSEAKEVLERRREGETDSQFKERLGRMREYAQECFSRMTHQEWQKWGQERARKENRRATQISPEDVERWKDHPRYLRWLAAKSLEESRQWKATTAKREQDRVTGDERRQAHKLIAPQPKVRRMGGERDRERHNEYGKLSRQRETPEQREERLRGKREYDNKRHAGETPEQREERLRIGRERGKAQYIRDR